MMSLTSISEGKQSNDFNASSVIKILLWLFFMFLYFYGNIFLYADDTCLVSQHKDFNEIEKQLHEDFKNICDWFVDNKLSIHFADDITTFILFVTKHKIKKVRKLNIRYENKQIKQHFKVKFLGRLPNQAMSGETMVLSVINKINKKLKFL